ncbi:MAG: peptidase, partial [Sphingobacteriales bacterium]
PTDLTKFIEGLFAGKLVNDSSLKVMKTIKDGFGSGMFPYNFDGKTGYGHDGGIDGFRSNLTYFPGEKLAVAYCSNGGTYSINGIGIAVLSILFNKPYKIPEFKTVTLKTEELDKYLGIYASEQMPLKITVTKKEATLIAQATGQGAFPLDALGDNKFAFEAAGIVLEFDPVKNEMTIKQGGRTTPFKKEK